MDCASCHVDMRPENYHESAQALGKFSKCVQKPLQRHGGDLDLDRLKAEKSANQNRRMALNRNRSPISSMLEIPN